MEGAIKDLGPCAVIFNSQDLGNTHGGVIFKYPQSYKPIKEDQKGDGEVDGIVTGGMNCEVTVPLTRTALARLAEVIPGAEVSDDLLEMKSAVGTSMFENAHSLILKPIEGGVASTDPTKWLTIPKAFPIADLELPFDNDAQRVYKVVFRGFPDPENDDLLFKIGA